MINIWKFNPYDSAASETLQGCQLYHSADVVQPEERTAALIAQYEIGSADMGVNTATSCHD